MTFLDNKGGSLKEGVTGGKADNTIRTVRVKREAEEAGTGRVIIQEAVLTYSIDKEYRKGVHHFETLRLRRQKILEGAFVVSLVTVAVAKAFLIFEYFKSLELFIEDASSKMRACLDKYTGNLL